jgi:putative transposase
LSEDELKLMRIIEELHLEHPFAGNRMERDFLLRDGVRLGRRHMRTVMRRMGIEAIYRKPNTSKPTQEHKIYHYLLRNVAVTRVNQVWATDISYVPMKRGCVYLVAVIDWFSRRVLSRKLSITMDVSFCLVALDEALTKHARPEIFNTDQGGQFTSEAFTGRLKKDGIAISMDGKGRRCDNVFVERFWRSIKYEEICLHAYDSAS